MLYLSLIIEIFLLTKQNAWYNGICGNEKLKFSETNSFDKKDKSEKRKRKFVQCRTKLVKKETRRAKVVFKLSSKRFYLQFSDAHGTSGEYRKNSKNWDT